MSGSDNETSKSQTPERKVWMTALESRFSEAEPNLRSSRKRLIREMSGAMSSLRLSEEQSLPEEVHTP